MGRPVIPGAFLLVYPCYAPPTARPVPLFQVMAATEAQGLGADQREDAAGVHGGIGCTDHEGECAVPRVQVICLHFSRALVHLTPSRTLRADLSALRPPWCQAESHGRDPKEMGCGGRLLPG